MSDINKILVVIDPTAASQPALERVARFRPPVEAQLMLLICHYEPYAGEGDAFARGGAVAAARAALLSKHRQNLERLAAPLKEQGVDVAVDVRWDYPLHEAIIRKAVEWGADLVVKDTHYHSVVRRSIFSNTDWNLIRCCPTQLLLVKPRAIGHVPCVVAAVDPLHPRDKAASLDSRVVTSAKELARLVGGQAHVLHFFDISPFILASTEAAMMPIAVPIPEIAAGIEKSHTEAVLALAATHGIPRERVHVLQGRSRQALVESTDGLGADVVVMGAVSRSALERLFVGSTAEAVLDKLSCDVLIVKPAGFKSPI
jgi:universal stress protein E